MGGTLPSARLRSDLTAGAQGLQQHQLLGGEVSRNLSFSLGVAIAYNGLFLFGVTPAR